MVRKFTSDARQLENANTELQSAQRLALFEGTSVRSHRNDAEKGWLREAEHHGERMVPLCFLVISC